MYANEPAARWERHEHARTWLMMNDIALANGRSTFNGAYKLYRRETAEPIQVRPWTFRLVMMQLRTTGDLRAWRCRRVAADPTPLMF